LYLHAFVTADAIHMKYTSLRVSLALAIFLPNFVGIAQVILNKSVASITDQIRIM